MNYAKLILKKKERIINDLSKGSMDELIFIQQRFHKTDVSRDRVFQFNFIHYYQMDRAKGLLTDKFVSAFFELLENSRNEIQFADCVMELQKVNKKINAVFASKLCATIKPEHSIYDKRVRRFFGLPVRYKYLGRRRLKCIIQDLEIIQKKSQEILKDKKIIKMISDVRRLFPLAKKKLIPDLRLIDLFIYHTNLK
ncbi:MAG TPA: hypothetical protein VMD27_10205 [Candidatus Aquilonibacter sp.]|nr:hypothetical protein [Candidatus Aquilonibacter sp.]